MRRKASQQGVGDAALAADDRAFVQVVARAFDVMRCFEGAGAELGNQDISRRTGLPPSTVSRLTYTLTRIGHLSYRPDLQRYRVGAGAVALSSALLHGMDLRRLVRPIMQDLAEQVPGTVGLTVRDRGDMVYVEYARSAGTVGLYSVVGSRISLALSAAGRAHAAGLEPEARAALLRDLRAAAPGPAAQLEQWLAGGVPQLLRCGYITSCGDWSPHINGVAMPIPMSWPRTSAGAGFVLGIGVLASVFDAARLQAEIAPLLLAAGAQVSALLNALPDAPLDPATPNHEAPPP